MLIKINEFLTSWKLKMIIALILIQLPRFARILIQLPRFAMIFKRYSKKFIKTYTNLSLIIKIKLNVFLTSCKNTIRKYHLSTMLLLWHMSHSLPFLSNYDNNKWHVHLIIEPHNRRELERIDYILWRN